MGKKFIFGESPAAKVAEEIRESHEPIEQGGLAQPIPGFNQQMQTVAQPLATAKPKKEKNGIVIDVPMDVYMQLTMIKLQTGRSYKELALQAVIEFAERNRVG